MKFLLLFSAQEECWSPGATSGGGQLHQAGEESRASMAGIDCRRSIGREIWVCEILILFTTIKI